MTAGCRIALSVDQLMAEARRIAGVDLVDEAVVEPLAVMHRALCEEAQLHEQGALWQQKKLLRLLANRLRMQRDFARHPQIADEPIDGPLLVMGMARSGTTKAQKVLAASGDFNFLPFWQAFNWASFTGVPNEAVDARVLEASDFCSWFEAGSPEAKYGHSFETFEPEEDTILTEGSFVAPSFIGYAAVPSYVQWLSGQSPRALFEFLRDCMKYLQWQGLASRSKRWLLKAPLYCGLEPLILDVFPDAKLVMTHRSPRSTLPSTCKLCTCFRRPFSDAPVDTSLVTEGFIATMALHVANRKAHPRWPMLDLDFDALTHAMPTAIEQIYAHAGLSLSIQARERMARWELDNAMHKHGEFRYSLAEFGLSEREISTRMADYIELQNRLFGARAGRAP